MTVRKTRTDIAVCLIAVLLLAAVMCLPLCTFSTTLYTKKSANTFPGDEKYLAVTGEIEQLRAEYAAGGTETVLSEDQTLRETSKGTTSLMTFTLSSQTPRTGFQILFSGFLPGWILGLICLFSLAALILLTAGRRKGPSVKKGACVLILLALLLVPVFAMASNYHFVRAVKLFSEGNDVAGTAGRLPLWNRLLTDGSASEETLLTMLSGLYMQISPLWWILLPALFAFLLAGVDLTSGRIRPALSRGALYLAVTVMSLVVIYPFFVMVITAFRTPSESTDMKFLYLFPTEWIWSNLSDIAARGVFTFLKNSILLSTGATLIAMLCGIPAAYAMSRMKFRGKKAFLGFIIMSQMFSPVVLLVGISKLMNTLNLSNSIIGLMFINAAFNQAFAIWLLRGTFVSISSEMEQAACIDGCNLFGALTRVLLPVAAPGIVTSLIFVFINSWNEYTISTVLITNRLNKPITVGITEFSSYNMIEWQYLFAAALLATVPVVILFICIEKHLVSGLTSGGVKG